MLRRCIPLFVLSFLIGHAASAQGGATWQQQVRYEMDVRLQADRHQFEGTQRLTYTNNSPDTLRRVFYHLYFNAFQPNSMMAERNRHLPDPDPRVVPRIFQLGPDEIGYQRIRSLTQNGAPVTYRIDDTVMEVTLREPLLPGRSAVFEMAFQGQVPLQTRRAGRDNREGIDFSMAQWYPKMAAYDEKGWHADPYIGREFYAPYGTFDVRLHVPSRFVVGATGVLQNPEQVGHGYSEAQPSADTLAWHFRAENVHDFAWAADPDYIHRVEEGPGGVKIHMLYQPDVASNWERLADFAPEILEILNEKFGAYAYPQFTIAQAGDGGMEYPMMIFITARGTFSGLVSVTAHEGGHQWFYSMVGTNETDHPWMDEGFTEYATDEVLAALTGSPRGTHTSALMNIMAAKYYGFYEPLDTRSDWFKTNAAYSVAAYSGGQAIAAMLGAVMSDSLRGEFIREYVRQFTFKHPYPADMERVAEKVSGLELDWFFDQMTKSTGQLDYAITGLRSVPAAGGAWKTTVRLRRRTDMAMPIDVRLTTRSGQEIWATIPLREMQGARPVPEGWTVAEPWPWTFEEYTLVLDTPDRVETAEADPLLRLPDENRLNNRSSFPLTTDFLRAPVPNWASYSVGWRPMATWSRHYGAGIGLQARGQYLFGRYRTKASLLVWPHVLFNSPEIITGSVPLASGFDYALQFADRASWLAPRAELQLRSEQHLGIMETSLGATIPLTTFVEERSQKRRALTLSLMHRNAARAFGFLPDAMPAFEDPHVVLATATYERASANGRWSVSLDAGGPVEQAFWQNTRLTGTYEKSRRFGRLTLAARALAGIGSPSLAPSRLFVLGSGSTDEAWRNAAFRTLAGATGRLRPTTNLLPMNGAGPVAHAGEAIQWGTGVLSGLASLSVQPLPRALPPLGFQVYAAAGETWGGSIRNAFDSANDITFEAGPAVSLNVGALRWLSRWTPQSDVLQGLRLVTRFPLMATGPGTAETFDFRWMVGVEL